MAKNILVIDDEELVVESLRLLLKREGYNVTIVRSGEEAIKKIEAAAFDLVISDVRMPGLDGIETIKQIRAYLKKSNKKLNPEILISGYADSDKYEEAISLKVAGYLYKPFDNAEFLQVIKKAIG